MIESHVFAWVPNVSPEYEPVADEKENPQEKQPEKPVEEAAKPPQAPQPPKPEPPKPVAGAPAAFTTNGNHRDGWTLGAGLEYMFAPNWSAKAEYQYYNFGSTRFAGGPAPIVGQRFRDDDHTVKLGVNYRFGWGGPVAAKY